MRKIEAQLNRAITQEKNFASGNTTVTFQDGVSTVFLHGNKIAEVGDTWLKLYDGGWQTATTKSRLSSILAVHGNGERIFQKDYRWFIQVENEVVPFYSGITFS